MPTITVDFVARTGTFVADFDRLAKKTQSELNKLAKDVREIGERFDESAKATRQFAADKKALDEALKRGVISQREYNALLAQADPRMQRMGQLARDFGKAIGLAAAAGVGALAALTKQAINNADALDEMSQRVGVSAKELSTLNYAAERGALDLGTFESAMVKLTKSASDTARGTGEAAAGFEALGISVKNADGTLKSSDQLLKEVATEFAGLEDGANKTALAVNLFGRAGAQMIPFLNQGAEGIAAVQEEARALGLEIENTTAALAGEFNDRLGDLRSLATGFGNDLAEELLPALTELASLAVENGKQMREAGGGATVLADAFKLVLAVAYTVKAAVEALVATIAGYIDVSIAAAKVAGSIADTLNPAQQVMRAFGMGTVSVTDAVGEFRDTLEAANDAAGSGVQDAINGLSDAMSALFAPTKAAAGALDDAGKSGREAAPALAAAGDAAKMAAEAAKQAAQAAKENDAIWKQSRRELEETERAWRELAEAQRRTAQRFAEQEADLRNEIRLLGLGTAARREAIIALEAERLARDETGAVVAEQAARYRELLTTLAAQQEIAEAAAAFENIWLDAANNVGDALTTALFDGAENGAEAIKDVMEQLARDLVRFWLQQNIVIPLQERIMGRSGGGAGSGGWQLGQGAGGIFAGGLLGYGATGSIGGALGGAVGSYFGNIGATMATQAVAAGSIGSTLGGLLGQFAPIVGTLLGSLLGNVLGDLFGDDPKPRLRINSSGAGIGNIGTRGTTALGSLAFNADDLEDTRGTERQLLQSIQALDQGFVTLVNTFGLGQTQLDALRDAAGSWSIDLRNSAITGEAVLGSRFGALLNTFDEHIVSFVGSAGTLEERMGRLTEALFIDAAAATGELVDDFDQLVELLDEFGMQGEAVDVTYRRLLQSTRLMEEAFSMMGASIDQTRESFVAMAQEFVDAAGGFDAAAGLLSGYYNRFFSEQERAEMLVTRAGDEAAAQFADIGLDLEDFLGPGGMQRFRDQFEALWPTLSAADRVEWLQAANALGFLNEALAELQRILDAAADTAEEAATSFRQLGNAAKPPGAPGLDFDLGGLNPGLPADPESPPPAPALPMWMIPGMPGAPRSIDVGATLGGDESSDRRGDALSLLLGEFSNLKDKDKLQFALEGLQSGQASAEDVLSIGRRLYGSGSDYNALFERVRAMQTGAADSVNAERPIEREQVVELQAVRAELAEVKALLGMTAEATGKTAEATGELAQGDRWARTKDAAMAPRSQPRIPV